MFSKNDRSSVISRYTDKYKKFGYSQKTLGWDKGKQDIRFDVLASQWDFEGATVLDIGCGFGDFFRFSNNKFGKLGKYTGLELVPSLIQEGMELYGDDPVFEIISGSITDWEPEMNYDFVIISGLFNFKLEGGSNKNYEFIDFVLNRSISVANKGVAANFLSDKVDYEYDNTFHSNPGKTLDICFKLTQNIVLRNDYFPFEFSVFLNKNDVFEKEDTIFNEYKDRL